MQVTATDPQTAPREVSVYGIRGDYQRPDTTMTLREGLAEYYRVNPGLSDPATATNPKSVEFFHNHDCTHVVFGTHTGPLDEGVNDMLTLFGVQLTAGDYLRGFLATDEATEISKLYANRSFFRLFWRTLKLSPKAWRMTRKMKKKWPWHPPASFMDRPLRELREEFGIELFRPNEELNIREPA